MDDKNGLGEAIEQLMEERNLNEMDRWDFAYTQVRAALEFVRIGVANSRERSLTITKLEEACMWLERCVPEEEKENEDDVEQC